MIVHWQFQIKTEDGEVFILKFSEPIYDMDIKFSTKGNVEEMVVRAVIPVKEEELHMLLPESEEDFDLSSPGEMVVVPGKYIDFVLSTMTDTVSSVGSVAMKVENVGMLKVLSLPEEEEIAVSPIKCYHHLLPALISSIP